MNLYYFTSDIVQTILITVLVYYGFRAAIDKGGILNILVRNKYTNYVLSLKPVTGCKVCMGSVFAPLVIIALYVLKCAFLKVLVTVFACSGAMSIIVSVSEYFEAALHIIEIKNEKD